MFDFAAEHFWWLILLIPFAIGVATRLPGTYIVKAQSHLAPVFLNWLEKLKKTLRRWAFLVPTVVKALILILLVAILVDFTRGYTIEIGKKVFQRFIVTQDSTSSMYGFTTDLSEITCKKNAFKFPRISGSCRALYRLIDDVERETVGEGSPRIGIGLLQFAYRSAVVSYITNDYKPLRKQVDDLKFKDQGLGAATNLHLALWDMYLMAFDRNLSKKSGFVHLSGKDLEVVYKALASSPQPFYLPKDISEKMEKVRLEMRDTVFFVVTDAVVSYLSGRMDDVHPSIRRLMQLAEFLELPVYYLSTDEDYPELKRLARRTGFGPMGGSYRGDFLLVRKDADAYKIDELISTIVKSRFGLTVPTYEDRRKSYSDLLLEFVLTLLVFEVLWSKLVTRSLTDVE